MEFEIYHGYSKICYSNLRNNDGKGGSIDYD